MAGREGKKAKTLVGYEDTSVGKGCLSTLRRLNVTGHLQIADTGRDIGNVFKMG